MGSPFLSFSDTVFEIRACTRLCRRSINAVAHVGGMNKIFMKMIHVLEKELVVTQGDVIEEAEMLVDLSDVANVRHHFQAEFFR